MIPVLLGAGVPQLEPAARRQALRLERARTWPDEVVSLEDALR